VRHAILSTVLVTKKALPVILDRARDVDDAVRIKVYHVIAEKINMNVLSIAHVLSIAQRIKLLTDAMNDRAGKGWKRYLSMKCFSNLGFQMHVYTIFKRSHPGNLNTAF
jgi:hypothetical protein